MNNNQSFTVWITGLSGSGKSTIAQALDSYLKKMDFLNIEVLDGDLIRKTLSKDLGFSKRDRIKNMKRVGSLCYSINNNNLSVIAALISPIRKTRNEIRGKIKNFVEVYVECPIEECERRDTKGLYKKARLGKIKNFTGINSPYEIPLNPEVICKTDIENSKKCVEKIIAKLRELNYLKHALTN